MPVIDKSHLYLLSGRAHPELAEEIAKRLGVSLGKAELGNFANGEISCRLNDSVRGCDVFIIQSHSGSVNDSIIEQALMIDAAKRSSAKSITAVCPFLGYARQDRKSNGREPIAARLIVDILSNAGADRIMSVDLHSGQTQGFFDGPFDHLIARPILLDYLKQNFKSDDMVIVSPDAGRVKMAERYSTLLNCEMAIVHKQRSTEKHNLVEAKYLIGDVKGKSCIIVDDMIDTAGTIAAAAELIRENGAKKVYGVATHGLFSGEALKRINDSEFDKIVVTNTLPIGFDHTKTKIEVLSVASLIADAIAAVYAGSSVSAIFDGQNQF
jgi:ribose-phosphate pyrophosphokinase